MNLRYKKKKTLRHNNTCKPYKLYVTDFSAIMCIPNETKALFEKKNEGCSQAENL